MDIQLKVAMQDGIIYPERNGKPLSCPHFTRVVLPSRMANALDLNAAICSSQCMKFKCGIGSNPDLLFIDICDTGIKLEAKLSELDPNKNSLLSI